MVFIVGLAGPGHVGKSTTSRNIIKEIQLQEPRLNVTSFAFANPIYYIAEYFTKIPTITLKDEIYKETKWTKKTAPIPCLEGWTPRKFLQIIGTECFRNNININFWIETSIKQISSYDIAIAEDARFSNEYKCCDFVIELKREGIDYLKNHASAMPPDKKYVDKIVKLYPNISYKSLTSDIIKRYKRK